MNILVTGGAGYIGAHAVRQLMQAGHGVVVIDNLTTGNKSNLPDSVELVEADFADLKVLKKIFSKSSKLPIDAVMHFAASIDLNESIEKPLEYLENNTLKTAVLVQAMLEHGVTKLIFSSTAAIYGRQEIMPIPETAKGSDLAPYGLSKQLSEDLIKAYSQSAGLDCIVFRYFNAAGSDTDKKIYPSKSTSLIPQVMAVAKGQASLLTIYGTDYDTIDGTGVRDYIHVLDIARAHVRGLEVLMQAEQSTDLKPGGLFKIYNIGTGIGWSVKQIVEAAKRITNKPIEVKFAPRRPVDVAIALADNAKIKSELGFALEHSDLDTLIQTSWY